MNLVLDDAEEVHIKTKNRKTLGMLRINQLFVRTFRKKYKIMHLTSV